MRTTIITAAVLPIFFLASCMAPHNEPPIQDLMRQHREKKNPPPEEVWNSTRVWVKVSAKPPIYIPNGYPLKAPRTEAAGEWFEDKRDGKRLFVPANGVAVWSESILRVLETVWCLAIANKASHTNPLPRLELKLISLVSKLSRLQTAEESRLRNRHRFRLEKALSDRSIYFGFPIVIPVRRNKQVREARRFQSHANQ